MSKDLDTQELRRKIDSGELKPKETCEVIESGNITNSVNNSVEYLITHGWDIFSANSCDRQWASFYAELFEYIQKQSYSEKKQKAVLSSIQVEHLHWDWFKKSMFYTGDGYEWFYMFADGKPQSACLIYHPKESVFDPGDIFYVEFVSVAPWNKGNPMRREFKGIGTLMIKCVLKYAIETLKLRPGFSLHSLPQAVGYYEKIGMLKFPKKDKDPLIYFELSKTDAIQFIGVA